MLPFRNGYVSFMMSLFLAELNPFLCDGNTGLFEQDRDQVLILNGTTLDAYLRSTTKRSVVLFYSAMCGHCQHFKKPFADAAINLQDMRSTVVMAAINCVPAGNRGACDKHKVHGYPTTKLFTPFQTNLTGIVLENLQVGASGRSVASRIADALFKDKSLEMNWTEFVKLKNYSRIAKQMNNLVLIDMASNKNDMLGNAVALFAVPYKYTEFHYVKLEDGSVLESAKEEMKKMFSKSEIAFPLLIRVTYDRRSRKPSTQLLRSGEKDIFVLAKLMEESMDDLFEAGPELSEIYANGLSLTQNGASGLLEEEQIKKIIKSRLPDVIYIEDLVSTVFYGLMREIPGSAPFQPEALDSLKKFLTVLTKFFPDFDQAIYPRQNLSSFITNATRKLLDILDEQPPVSPEEWKQSVTKVYKNVSGHSALPPETWINCLGSQPKFRGYPCGVWTLFHTLQVSAYAKNPEDTSVITAMVGFIESFFSCLDCRENFAKETAEYKKFLLDGKTSIAYLWRLHNSVNARLSGDITEDPTHKKTYFPTYQQCQDCFLVEPETPLVANGSQLRVVSWNEGKVVKFLRSFYGIKNMMFFYTKDQAIFSFASLNKDRKKSLLLNSAVMDTEKKNYFSVTDVLLLIAVYVVSVGCILAVCYYFQRRNIQRCRGTNNKATRYAFA